MRECVYVCCQKLDGHILGNENDDNDDHHDDDILTHEWIINQHEILHYLNFYVNISSGISL